MQSGVRGACDALATVGNWEAERRPDGKGGYFITLPRDVLNKLNYLRGQARATAA
jgi:hypothetical protein